MYKPISLLLLALVIIGLPIATILNGGTLYIGMFGFVTGWFITFNGVFCLWGCYCDYKFEKELNQIIPKHYYNPMITIGDRQSRPQGAPQQSTDNKSKQKAI